MHIQAQLQYRLPKSSTRNPTKDERSGFEIRKNSQWLKTSGLLLAQAALLFTASPTYGGTCWLTPTIESSVISGSRIKSGYGEYQLSYPPKIYKQKYVSYYLYSYYSYDWSPWAGYPFYGWTTGYKSTFDTERFDSGWVSGSGWKDNAEYWYGNGNSSYQYRSANRIGQYDWSDPYCPDPVFFGGGTETYSPPHPTIKTRNYQLSVPVPYWYGNDYRYCFESRTDQLTDEYSTFELRGQLIGYLASQSWPGWSYGSSSAYYSLTSDEVSAEGGKMRYRFRFPTIANAPYAVTWTVRTYYNSGGSSSYQMTSSITGTGGEVFVGDYEQSPPGQSGYITVENVSVSYQSPWGPWSLQSAPSLGVSANYPGNQCIGVQMSVTANLSTSNGVKIHSDSCGNSETAPLVFNSTYVWWTVSGVSASPSSGNGTTATFTPTSSGTAAVTFYASATTSDPYGYYSASSGTVFDVVEVWGLIPNSGCEIDDGDGNPHTKTYLVSPATSVTVFAMPNPNVSESALPGCWNLSGGNGSSKLMRSVYSSGTHVITCTAGSSSKTTTLVLFNFLDMVFKRSNEPDSYYSYSGGGDILPQETYTFKARTDVDIGSAASRLKWYVINEPASGTGNPFNATMTTLGGKIARIWVDCDGNGTPDFGEASMSVSFQVVPLVVHYLTFARHIDVPFPNASADSFLNYGTARLRNRDHLDDLRCGVELRRSGDVAVFGVTGSPAGTPPSVSNNSSQYAAVMNVVADVKILFSITHPDIAFGITQGTGIRNIIMHFNPLHSTLVHEFGHVKGLEHVTTPDHRIMALDYDGTQNTLDDSGRAAYRVP